MSFKIVKKTTEEIMEAQKKREQEMRERELKRKQEEEEKRKQANVLNKPAPFPTENLSRAEQERLKAEQEYEEQQKLRKQQELERRLKEEEELKKRAQERTEKDRQGQSIHDVDWKVEQDKRRLQEEREREKRYKELNATATANLRKAQQESEARQQQQQQTPTGGTRGGGLTQEELDAIAKAPEQHCTWGCKCTGWVEKSAASRTGPAVCAVCGHAKSMHNKK
jgi:DNA repair exonuclease SbcCD ATPase subunit